MRLNLRFSRPMTREGQSNDTKSNDRKQSSTLCQWEAAGFNDKKPTYNDNGANSTTKGTCNDKRAFQIQRR